jgi:hypothetical protein
MSKILFILVLTVIVNTLIQAQTKTPVSSKYPNNSSISLTPPPAAKAVPPQQLPDLKIVSINIAKLSSSPDAVGMTKYVFEVSYTIKNEGNNAIDARLVDVSGSIDYENATVARPIAGCGGVLTTLSGNMINPGATYGGSYRCYGVSLENSQKYIYALKVDGSEKVAELNEQNNSAQISILF